MYSWQVKDYNACRKDIWMLGMGYLELNMIAQCAIIWISLTCLNCVKSNCDFSFSGKLYRRWRPNFWPLPFYFTVNITQPRHRLNRRCYQIWPKIFPLYHIILIIKVLYRMILAAKHSLSVLSSMSTESELPFTAILPKSEWTLSSKMNVIRMNWNEG